MTDNNNYLYLSIPIQYQEVYEYLLIKLSDLGKDMLTDCLGGCKGQNQSVVQCWIMFQTACAAFAIGETKKANLLIRYINAKLNINANTEIFEQPSVNLTLNKSTFTDTGEFKAVLTINATNIDYIEGTIKVYPSTGDWTKEIIPLSITTYTNIELNVVEGNDYVIYAEFIDTKGNTFISSVNITYSEISSGNDIIIE